MGLLPTALVSLVGVALWSGISLATGAQLAFTPALLGVVCGLFAARKARPNPLGWLSLAAVLSVLVPAARIFVVLRLRGEGADVAGALIADLGLCASYVVVGALLAWAIPRFLAGPLARLFSGR